MSDRVFVGVLASGSGSNLQALLDGDLGPARVVVAIVNRPGARALQRARAAGIDAVLIDHRQFESRRAFDAAVVTALFDRGVRWVVLAGFMRIVSDVVLSAFPNRVINIHPSLLPSFPGINAQTQALRAGVKVAGCTVHLVDSGLDSGPILAQAAVPVLPDDDIERLSQRILQQEHRVLPAVVRAVAEGRLVIRDDAPPFLAELPAGRLALVNPSFTNENGRP